MSKNRSPLRPTLLAAACLLAASSAHALLPGHTVCYDDSGHAVMDPPNPDDYANCVTRPAFSVAVWPPSNSASEGSVVA